MPLSPLSERNDFSAVIIRTDFTDEAAWRRVTAQLESSSHHHRDLRKHYVVIDSPELAHADTDTILTALSTRKDLNSRISVVFVADSATMRAAHHALLAIRTLTRKDLGDDTHEVVVGFGREFRTVPGAVNEIHANLQLANMNFEDFSSVAREDSEGVFRAELSTVD